MSQPTLDSNSLIGLLDKFAEQFAQGVGDESLLGLVVERLPGVSDLGEFRAIASHMWDKYFSIDVDTMIKILRRWVQVEPDSKEAKLALGSYLLGHGSDWDEEGHKLLAEANS